MKKMLLGLCILGAAGGLASAAPTQVSTGLNTTCKIDAGALYCAGDNSHGQLGNGTTSPASSTTFVAVSSMSSGVTQVSVAEDGYNVCAIKSGVLYCWGKNDFGQIGDGTTTERDAPTAVDTTHGMNGTVIQVSTSKDHTCATQSTLGTYVVGGTPTSGYGFCWGDNSVGQLGNNKLAAFGTVIVPTAGAPFYVTQGPPQFATAGGMTCYAVLSPNLTGYKDIMCAGANTNGQLGRGTTSTFEAQPVVLSTIGQGNGTTVVDTLVTVSENHACALSGSTGAKPYCWGLNTSGQVGDGTTTSPRSTPTVVSGSLALTSISDGKDFTCGTSATGGWCWGHGDRGQLDSLPITTQSSPLAMPAAHLAATSITTGDSTTCFIHSSAVFCVGSNGSGQQGNGTSGTDQWDPYTNPNAPVHHTAAGYEHSCAIGEYQNPNLLYCWGDDSHGELGQGTSGGVIDLPTYVSIPSDVTDVSVSMDSQVASAGFTTCAVDGGDGVLYCWGKNDVGQVGNGTSGSDVTSPTAVTFPNGGNPVKVSTAGDHTCALVDESTPHGGYTLYCWGANTDGQLGIGSFTGTYSTPQLVSSTFAYRMSDVAANTQYTCATQTLEPGTSSTYCWGKNDFAQLGNGTTTHTNAPGSAIANLGTYQTSLSTGWGHACALKNGSLPYCWGNNFNGELGDNTTTQRSTPVAVSNITAATLISAGGDHTCAEATVSGTTSLYCWGWDGRCQLGIGTTTVGHTTSCKADTHVPTIVTAPIVTHSIAAGGYHSEVYGVISIGPMIYTTGENSSGQCGNSTTTGGLGTKVTTFLGATAPSPNW